MKTFTVTLFINDSEKLPHGFTVHMEWNAKTSGDAIYEVSGWHHEAFGGNINCIGVREGHLFNGPH